MNTGSVHGPDQVTACSILTGHGSLGRILIFRRAEWVMGHQASRLELLIRLPALIVHINHRHLLLLLSPKPAPPPRKVGRLGLRVGGHPALSLHSSNERGELSVMMTAP